MTTLLKVFLVCALGRAQQQTCKPPPGDGLVLTNRADRFLVTSTGKAGATVATQLMLRREGLMKQTARFGQIHDYRQLTFEAQENHKPLPPGAVARACSHGWTCVAILRSPLDRVVSSYYHIMLHKNFRNQIRPRGASFRQFVNFLGGARGGRLSHFVRGHAGSQAWAGELPRVMPRRASRGPAPARTSR